MKLSVKGGAPMRDTSKCKTMTAHMITASLMERVEEGELRAIVDSPDEWE